MIPVVNLVLEGGLGTLKRVSELSSRVPLVIIRSSGGISDLLVDAKSTSLTLGPGVCGRPE